MRPVLLGIAFVAALAGVVVMMTAMKSGKKTKAPRYNRAAIEYQYRIFSDEMLVAFEGVLERKVSTTT